MKTIMNNVNADFNILGDNLKGDISAETQYKLISSFCEENNLILIELNTAWVENSTARRTVSDYNNADFSDYPKLTDRQFLDKVSKKYQKRDILYIYSTFWGIKTMKLYTR